MSAVYAAVLIWLTERHGLRPLLFVDKTQVTGTIASANIGEHQTRISTCIDEAARRMLSPRLRLSTDEVEVLCVPLGGGNISCRPH
jgi:hypothetical protein